MDEWIKPAVLNLGKIVELIGAGIIDLGLLLFLYRFILSHVGIKPHRGNVELRVKFGSYLTLALELLLAADILQTAVAPTWDDIGKLAAIAIIRTVLNYFLERDIKNWEKEKEKAAVKLTGDSKL
ncbi:MAG: DUF1622 domain-containing protein [Ginsengibacter sp.]